MRRVSVVGSSGAGKSTLARALAKRLEVQYVELDAFMHQPGWQQRPDDEFMEEVDKATSQPGWVVDGNYRGSWSKVRFGSAPTQWSGSTSPGEP